MTSVSVDYQCIKQNLYLFSRYFFVGLFYTACFSDDQLSATNGLCVTDKLIWLCDIQEETVLKSQASERREEFNTVQQRW